MMVVVGTLLLIGTDQVVLYKEVALAIAEQKVMGTTGLVIVIVIVIVIVTIATIATIATNFSTGSAINATLIAIARLTYKVAEVG
jgi:hypothetical protein